MKLKKAIVFVLCAVLALPMFACGKAARPGGGGVAGDGKTYTVTFYVGAEAEAAGALVYPDTIEVKSGGTCGELPVPHGYKGYSFIGWKTADGADFLATTVVRSDITVTAQWRSQSEQDDIAKKYEESLATAEWNKAGHIYIHYKRSGHAESENGTVKNLPNAAPEYSTQIESSVYKDWGLWVWPIGNANGRLFNAMHIDESGAVYDVDLTYTYTDCGWDPDANGGQGASQDVVINYDDYNTEDGTFGILLHQISSRSSGKHWISDGGNTNVYLSKARRKDKGMHWFVTQGNVGFGTPQFTGEDVSSNYDGIPEGSAITRADGDDMINSALDNSSKYPVWPNRVQNFDASTGYQIFIASFADSNGDGMGDLRGIIQKLPYLASLNVEVLWLTPFQNSTNYHGYDIYDYFSVDPKFGTLADYRELVYRAHNEYGMKIVMDFVLNHTGKSNPWFVKSQNLEKEKIQTADGKTREIDYRQFYNWINKETYDSLDTETQKQWYGDSYGYYFYSSFSSDMPELNYDYQPVRDAILEVCDYWMSFGLDGFRLDAVKHIYMKNEIMPVGKTLSGTADKNNPAAPVVEDGLYSHDKKRNINFYREFNYRLKSAHPNAFVVGENLDGWNERTKEYYQGIDSQFDFNTYYAGRAFAEVRGIPHLSAGAPAKSEADLHSAFRTYLQGYTSFKGQNPNFVAGQFTSNHDLPRARNRMALKASNGVDTDHYTKVEGSLISDSENALFMYYGMLMTLPGVTWIYYGDELGMEGIMDYTLETQSTDSLTSSPHEDRIYRQPMKWEATGNASYKIGFGELTCELTGLNASTVKSVAEQEQDASSLLSWVKTLTAIRTEYKLGNATAITDGGTNGNKISYTVRGGNGNISVSIIAGSGALTSGPAGAKAFWTGSIAGKTCSVLVTAA